MPSDLWRRVAELFDEVLEQPPEDRAAWLAGLTGTDAELRPELERWLVEEGYARGFLEQPVAPGASWDRDAWLPHAPGHVVGRYRIRRAIGMGGTSVVYEAEQIEPRRAVALKVFQTGLGSTRARVRFEDEAQILADLVHPGIAQVFDAGTETGDTDASAVRRPWIAMELVAGARTITRHAREEELPRGARIELFARVCDAVAHGHQRGVIHRDLKPANLLVDAQGAPKVIDFGLARGTASGEPLTRGLFGTLAWMAPELFASEPGTADTRADVYALGVVLYELLCDRRPHELEGLSLELALRTLREEPVRWPALDERIDRDLAAVVQKALSKDPEGRYVTAAELAADLRRHLASVPVVARPPSVLHHARLALARRRSAALAGAAVVLLLAGTLAFGIVRAERVEARERARANDVTRFLKSILAFASPADGNPADLTLRAVLDDASRRIDVELAGAPDARAELHAVFGSAWRELGQLERAEEHLLATASLFRGTHPGSEELANSLSILSEVLLAAERGADAEAVLREALAIHTGRGDMPRYFLGIVTNKLAQARRLQGDLDEAETLARTALAIYREVFGDGHRAVAAALHTLAAIQLDRGLYAAAEAHARDALAIDLATWGETSSMTARARLALAEILLASGRGEAARAELDSAVPVLRTLLPAEHPDRLRAAELAERVGSDRRKAEPGAAGG